MITDFFKNVSDLRDFAPNMPTDDRIENLEPFYRTQYQKVLNVIGLATYTLLKEYFAADDFDETSVSGIAVGYLRGALANLTAIPFFIFKASERNLTDKKVYRYQEDQQIEIYLENAWTELDFLINHLDANIVTFTDFPNTNQYKIRQTLFIKNALDFQRYYGGINSSYFFSSIVSIIEEVQIDKIKPRIKKDLSEITDTTQKYIIGKAITYETLSRACLQLDYTELPKGFRNDIVKEIREERFKNQSEIKATLSRMFADKANDYFIQLEDTENPNRNAGVFIVPESTLTTDDKFYMPSC